MSIFAPILPKKLHVNPAATIATACLNAVTTAEPDLHFRPAEAWSDELVIPPMAQNRLFAVALGQCNEGSADPRIARAQDGEKRKGKCCNQTLDATAKSPARCEEHR